MMKRIIIVIAIMIMISATALPVLASTEGLAADRLIITVGYFGGPYYEKAVFTVDELWAMDVQYIDYTAIDNMPSVVITYAAGITLADLMDAAGIDLGSVQNFNFWTNDKEGGYYNSMTKAYLIDTPRYCYYSLPDNFDYDEGMGNEYATADGVRVPTMIALADDWRRSLAGASFGSDYMNLDPSVRFRLVYGQTDAVTRTASDSAKWIHRIEVTLGGAPTLTLDASVLELEVGSKHRTEARINAADPVIAANAEITWSSSDGSIATVDADGEITVHAEGSATIMAEWGGQSVSVNVSGTEAPVEDGELKIENEGTEDAGDGGNHPIGYNPRRFAPPPSMEGGITATPPQRGMKSEANEDAGVLINDERLTINDEEMQPTADISPLAESKPMIIGREISIISSPVSESSGDSGGLQNWRRDEMADTAIELPIIPNEVKLTYLIIALALFFVGGIVEYARFKFS